MTSCYLSKIRSKGDLEGRLMEKNKHREAGRQLFDMSDRQPHRTLRYNLHHRQHCGIDFSGVHRPSLTLTIRGFLDGTIPQAFLNRIINSSPVLANLVILKTSIYKNMAKSVRLLTGSCNRINTLIHRCSGNYYPENKRPRLTDEERLSKSSSDLFPN